MTRRVTTPALVVGILVAAATPGAAAAKAGKSDNGAGGTSYPGYQPPPTTQPPQHGLPPKIAAIAQQLTQHPLRRGSRGALVRQLQALLTQAGFPVPQVGRFGATTERQVRHFQSTHQLPASGVVDPPTAMAIATTAAQNPGSAPSSPTADGGWVFPLYPLKRVESTSYWSLDQGVDLGGTSTACGPRLIELAVGSGTVVKEGIQGFGSAAPVIQLDSGPDAGRYVYYGHTAPALVAVGDHVSAGQPVGEVGCGIVGISSAPHLEIGISTRGGPTCCPGFHVTSGEVLTQLLLAYHRAKVHQPKPTLPPTPAPAHGGSGTAAGDGTTGGARPANANARPGGRRHRRGHRVFTTRAHRRGAHRAG